MLKVQSSLISVTRTRQKTDHQTKVKPGKTYKFNHFVCCGKLNLIQFSENLNYFIHLFKNVFLTTHDPSHSRPLFRLGQIKGLQKEKYYVIKQMWILLYSVLSTFSIQDLQSYIKSQILK